MALRTTKLHLIFVSECSDAQCFCFNGSHVILQVLPIKKKKKKELLVLSKICIYHVRGKMLLLQVCILSHQPKLKTLSEIIIVIHLPTFLYPVKSAHYLKEKCFKD